MAISSSSLDLATSNNRYGPEKVHESPGEAPIIAEDLLAVLHVIPSATMFTPTTASPFLVLLDMLDPRGLGNT